MEQERTTELERMQGPSPLEVEFLKELYQELDLFLKSQNFSTIKHISLSFQGEGYRANMQLHK